MWTANLRYMVLIYVLHNTCSQYYLYHALEWVFVNIAYWNSPILMMIIPRVAFRSMLIPSINSSLVKETQHIAAWQSTNSSDWHLYLIWEEVSHCLIFINSTLIMLVLMHSYNISDYIVGNKYYLFYDWVVKRVIESLFCDENCMI